MKKLFLLLVLFSALRLSAQTSEWPKGYEPAWLFTNGSGSIFPLKNGQMVLLNHNYLVIPIPAPGYKFAGWGRVNVFTFAEYTVDAGSGDENPPVISTVLSPLPISSTYPVLDYHVWPAMTLYDVPGVVTVTQSQGWMAYFVPINQKQR